MRLHELPFGFVGVVAGIAVSWACTAESTDSAEDASGSAGGKADGVDTAPFCPANVTLNSARGSAKRCIDEDSGRFVATECCVDVCAGAGWREQSNGTFCAWLDDPGLEGAQVGQFAPATCCNLNDDLACGRAEGTRGDCVDPQSQRGVEDVCCEPAPLECHPSIRSSISSCLFDQLQSFGDDPEALTPAMPELFELCTNEGDLIAPEIDQRCNFQPELPFCGLEFEQVDDQFIGPCREVLRDNFDCTFGRQYPDIFDQFHLTIVSDRDFELADALAADAVTQEQILIAARQSAFEDVASLQEAFEFFDDNFTNVVEIYDLSSNRAFTAYEFGAGDNGFGAIFDSGTTNAVTVINDAFLQDATVEFSDACGVPTGPGGRPCGGETTCVEGFTCEGTIDHPVFGTLGRCVDASMGEGFNGNDCSELRGCGPEAYCAGLSFGGSDGLCQPAWMWGQVENDSFDNDVPDGGQTEVDLFIYGAGTVPMDLELEFVLFHDTDISQLSATLIGPLRDEGTIATVFDGPDADLPPGTRSRRFRMNAPFPGDEDINGQWTLLVEDASGEGGGGVFDFKLSYSSRFD